ncbi:MAG: YqgE/AlgH family protein [Ornithinimicrobium sp.]
MVRRVDVAGKLLIAMPALDDMFAGSIVLVLYHDDDGSQGIILNKPLEVAVHAVLPRWHAHVSAPATLYQGGPVGKDSAIGLVRLPPTCDPTALVGVNVLGQGLGLVDLDAPSEVVIPQIEAMRVFVGYAGWTGGQLAGEIADGAWEVADTLTADPFCLDAAAMWRDVVVRQRGPISWLATYTATPGHN